MKHISKKRQPVDGLLMILIFFLGLFRAVPSRVGILKSGCCRCNDIQLCMGNHTDRQYIPFIFNPFLGLPSTGSGTF